MATVANSSRNRKPATLAFVAFDAHGNRHVFGTAAERDTFRLYTKVHSEAQGVADQAAGSLAALVCDPTWRMARER